LDEDRAFAGGVVCRDVWIGAFKDPAKVIPSSGHEADGELVGLALPTVELLDRQGGRVFEDVSAHVVSILVSHHERQVVSVSPGMERFYHHERRHATVDARPDQGEALGFDAVVLADLDVEPGVDVELVQDVDHRGFHNNEILILKGLRGKRSEINFYVITLPVLGS